MLVKDIVSLDFSLYNKYKNAAACVFIDKDSNLILNRDGNLYASLSNIPQDFLKFPVASHSASLNQPKLLRKHRPSLKLSKNALFAEQLRKLPADALVLVIYVSTDACCFVVTEKYYNDGTHNTSTKCMMTCANNISANYYQTNDADVFVSAFDTENDALSYLRSKSYISNVQSRALNRVKKCGGTSVVRY